LLADLNAFVAETVGEGRRGATQPARVAVLLPDGLRVVADDRAWRDGLARVGETEWLDGSALVVVDV
jgi:hypothetical protein